MNIIIWALVTGLYLPTLKVLYTQRWDMIDYTHAYFILPVSLFLVWWKRAQIVKALACPAGRWDMPVGGALLALGLMLYVMGWRQEMLMLSALSLIFVLFGVVLYQYNGAVARVVAFPVLYLLFMVPPPLGILDSITLPMRHAVSVMTEIVLLPFLPVHRDGLLLMVEQTQVYIGAPCSGFRSLVSILALAVVYVYVIQLGVKRKLLMLAAVIPMALAANLLRVVSLTIVTHVFGKEAGEGPFHPVSGAVIFLLLTFALIGLGKVLSAEGDYE